MEIQITNDGVTTIAISGRLDTINAQDFEKEIAQVMAGDMKEVVLDCAELSYISSSGLRHFLGLKKSSLTKGGKLFIKGMQPDIKDIFAMTGFTAMFEFID